MQCNAGRASIPVRIERSNGTHIAIAPQTIAAADGPYAYKPITTKLPLSTTFANLRGVNPAQTVSAGINSAYIVAIARVGIAAAPFEEPTDLAVALTLGRRRRGRDVHHQEGDCESKSVDKFHFDLKLWYGMGPKQQPFMQ